MVRIIAIEREYGAGGAAISRKLAARLGWKLWDDNLTEEIAKLAKVDKSTVDRCNEKVDPLIHRLARVFARGSFEPRTDMSATPEFDADAMVRYCQQVIDQAARQGNSVIVGRGAPYFLRDRADTFSVFIFAPIAEKMRRLRELGKSSYEAEHLLSTIDKERSAFVKKYYNCDWPSRALYHLMINSKVGDELVMDLILREISALDSRVTASLTA